MKKIGIIGGIGPESTVDYYKQIITAFKSRGNGLAYPEIIIYSADLSDLLTIIEAEQWDRMADWLVVRLHALQQAGAEFAAIGSNTPHLVFEQVQSRSPLPLVSIVAATRDYCRDRGFKRPGLMGTRLTMQSDFYARSFSPEGMAVFVPCPADQDLIHEKIFTEIELGIVKDDTRQALLAVVQRMIDSHAIDALILGCTELPLILNRDLLGLPFLNTTAIHVDRIVRYCRE